MSTTVVYIRAVIAMRQLGDKANVSPTLANVSRRPADQDSGVPAVGVATCMQQGDGGKGGEDFAPSSSRACKRPQPA